MIQKEDVNYTMERSTYEAVDCHAHALMCFNLVTMYI